MAQLEALVRLPTRPLNLQRWRHRQPAQRLQLLQPLRRYLRIGLVLMKSAFRRSSASRSVQQKFVGKDLLLSSFSCQLHKRALLLANQRGWQAPYSQQQVQMLTSERNSIVTISAHVLLDSAENVKRGEARRRRGRWFFLCFVFFISVVVKQRRGRHCGGLNCASAGGRRSAWRGHAAADAAHAELDADRAADLPLHRGEHASNAGVSAASDCLVIAQYANHMGPLLRVSCPACLLPRIAACLSDRTCTMRARA